MAIMNVRVNHLKERSGGDAAGRVVRYLQREGEYAPVTEAVDYLTRTSPATLERDDLVYQQAENLPAWAGKDAKRFFAAAERYERQGARWGTTWQMALPRELSHDEQQAMAAAFLRTHLAQHAYLWVMHDPINEQGEHQPHIHVLFSERQDDGRDRDPAQYFRRPEVGGCPKDPWFKQRSSLYALRESWADFTNYTLECAGHAPRVHPRSLRARDIDRKPEPKGGLGHDPEKEAERARIRQQRNQAKEEQLAAQGWELRKARLGISNVQEISAEQFLAEGLARARGLTPGQWDRTAPSPQAQRQQRQERWQAKREAEAQKREQELTRLEAHVQTLQDALAGVQVPMGRLVAALAASHEDSPRGGGLRMSLRPQEDGYGR